MILVHGFEVRENHKQSFVCFSFIENAHNKKRSLLKESLVKLTTTTKKNLEDKQQKNSTGDLQ